MDFGLLPPEINSVRMFAGTGSRPMSATSEAWEELALELSNAAAGYQSVTLELASRPWLGQVSDCMLKTATYFATWLCAMATLAEEAATQSKEAEIAHEAARSTTVQPSVIAANRKLRMSMVAVNALAQYAPAIADTDAHYDVMWAQDAAAMYCYADESTTASKVRPFGQPPVVANLAWLVARREAVSQSVSAVRAAGIYVQDVVSTGFRLIAAVPQALEALVSPSSSNSQLSSVSSSLSKSWHGRTAISIATKSGIGAVESAGLSGLVGGSVSAGIGQAISLEKLSVPQNWLAVASAPRPVVVALPDVGRNADLPRLASIAGYGVGATSRFMLRPKVVPRCPMGG